MKMRTLKTSLMLAALVYGLALAPVAALAKQDGQGSVSINNTQGRVSVKLDRGSKVAISNRYGRITITGWDRDTVEATATNEKGAAEAIQVELTADPQARSVLSLYVVGRNRGSNYVYAPGATPRPTISAEERERIRQEMKDKIKEGAKSGVVVVPMPEIVVEPNVVVRPQPPARQTAPAQPTTPRPAPAPSARGTGSGSGSGSGSGAGGSWGVVVGSGGGADNSITLDVKVPRYAELSGIELRSGDLTISNVDGPISVSSGSSNVHVNHVGALEVRTRSGDVTIEDVTGLAFIVASSGNITVRRAQADVRAVSINGDIDIQCVRGHVDVSNARGAIKLAGISGDVDATTTSSNITYTGAIRDNGRYRLKSVEGQVLMSVPDNTPGFTAYLSSYNGGAQTDFTIKESTPQGTPNQRVEARHGNGQAQITLDSFSQPVRLVKLAGASAGCP